ncbi:hypothetical protein SAMN04488000_101878 [Lentzea albida]|uniref:Uncharacterized protein n=1 Tax=Lentzea albida TaxID=65499 RepID=A0A1H9CBD6_9PSEU|nr:hypothetical protein SAMN04488000_101878 [Lentzea albida]
MYEARFVPTTVGYLYIRIPHLEVGMIVLGLILLVVGWLMGISILTTLGVVLLVIGAILAVLGAVGKPIGGRAHYF